MLPDTPSVSQLSHVISQAAAPAFLLGAMAAFIAILISRLNRIVDRTIILNAISDEDTVKFRLKTDLPRLMRRAAMMNRAIFWAVISSITITVLVIVAFASAFFEIQHERGVAILFIVRPSPRRSLILPARCALLSASLIIMADAVSHNAAIR